MKNQIRSKPKGRYGYTNVGKHLDDTDPKEKINYRDLDSHIDKIN